MNIIYGIIIGFALCSFSVGGTFNRSEIDGWIGKGNKVYKFEYVCQKQDRDCLDRNGIDLGDRG